MTNSANKLFGMMRHDRRNEIRQLTAQTLIFDFFEFSDFGEAEFRSVSSKHD